MGMVKQESGCHGVDAHEQASPDMDFTRRLLDMMADIKIEPRRWLLNTPEVQATISMLRGVWGRALRRLDRAAYQSVFEGQAGLESLTIPRYILRPGPPDPAFSPAVEWILLGSPARYGPMLRRAWNVAGGMGLGPNRTPFSIKNEFWLDVTGNLHSVEQRWCLDNSALTYRSLFDGHGPVRLRFNTPLRLLRKGRLIQNPTFADIAVALTRRIVALSNNSLQDSRAFVQSVAAKARQLSSTVWRGEQAEFVRWSGSQYREVQMRGVVGTIDLPTGAGPLWPLLTAGPWIHIGKGTVFGLGHLEILPL